MDYIEVDRWQKQSLSQVVEWNMNNGQFGKKKRIQVAYLGFMHIWVLAFGNKYYLRVCYDPQFLVTKDYGTWGYYLIFGEIHSECNPGQDLVFEN